MGKIVATALAATGIALLLSSCGVSPSSVVRSSQVSVASDQPFSSLNPLTSAGSGSVNTAVSYATNAGFTYYTDTLDLLRDESFGSYEVIIQNPLTVRYTVTDGVRWSDGTAVDAADLLLSWTAASGAYNDPDFDTAVITDEQTGEFIEGLPAGVVYFDSEPNSAMQLVTSVPEMSSDRRSITLIFDDPFADWEGAFYAMGHTGPPAHVVASLALDLRNPQAAKDAIVRAVLEGERNELSRISDVWNRSFVITELPQNANLLVSSGPYSVTDFIAGQYVTLSANTSYVGDRQPSIERIVVRYIPDPLAAVQALSTREVEIITPTAGDEVLSALGALDFVLQSVPGPVHDSIELRVLESKNNVFVDERVREAFLLTIPRDAILESIYAPTAPGGVVRNSFVFFPGSPGYAETIARNGSEEFAVVNIEAAQALLADAAVVPPEVCVLFPLGDALLKAEFELIQESAARAGITVTDCSTDDWRGQLAEPGAYDAVLSATRTQARGLSSVTERFSSDSEQSYTGFSDARIEGVLDDLQAESGPAERLVLAERLDSLLFDTRYGLPIVQRPIVLAFDSSAVVGVSRSPLSPGVFWNVWSWKPPFVIEG
jgi:peptide/nickel transport system substrate-binding protein